MSTVKSYEVIVGSRKATVSIRREGVGWAVQIDDRPEQIFTGDALGGTEWRLREPGRQHQVGVYLDGDRFDAQVRGHAIRGEIMDPRRKAFDATSGSPQGEIRTPMPGAVVRVPVSVGQVVQPGQVLVVVEAMKMENEFKAPFAGIVSGIHVQPGQTVEVHTVLLSLTAEGT